jgi:hypothetical protein
MNAPKVTGEQLAKAATVMRALEWRMTTMWSNPITPEEAGTFSARLMMSAESIERSLRAVEVEVTL